MSKTNTRPSEKNKMHKAIETWFTKIYLNKIIHKEKNDKLFVNITSCLAFILSIYGKTDENKSKMHLLLWLISKKQKTLLLPN